MSGGSSFAGVPSLDLSGGGVGAHQRVDLSGGIGSLIVRGKGSRHSANTMGMDEIGHCQYWEELGWRDPSANDDGINQCRVACRRT
eukprot:gene19641-6818_t